MKPERLGALTFILVGCLGAAALGFIVWKESSPTGHSTDLAMRSTAVSTSTPISSSTPRDIDVATEERLPNYQTLAAIDSEDPYLAPHAYLAPRIQSPSPSADSQMSIAHTSPEVTTVSGQLPSSTVGSPNTTTPTSTASEADDTTRGTPSRTTDNNQEPNTTAEPEPTPEVTTTPDVDTTEPSTTESEPTETSTAPTGFVEEPSAPLNPGAETSDTSEE